MAHARPPTGPSLWPVQLVIVGFLTLTAARYLTNDLSVLVLFGFACLAFYLTPARTAPARLTLDFHFVFLIALACSSLIAWIIATWGTETLLTRQVMPYFLILGAIVVLALRLQTLDRSQTAKCLTALFDGMALYALVNVLAYFVLGLRSPAEEFRAQDASALSWFDSRITFPLSNGLSIPPAIAAAYMICYPFIRSSGNPTTITQWFRLAGFLASVLILLAAGVRIPMLAAIVLLLGMRLFPRLTVRTSSLATAGLLLLPLWWSLTSGMLAGPGESVTRSLPIFSSEKRAVTDREYIASLSSRTDIWDTVLDFAGEMSAPDLLFGYGAMGQISSGISHETAYLFQFIENPEVASAHNSFLQQFVDQGLVGSSLLLFAVTATALAAARLYRSASSDDERSWAFAAAGMVVVLAASGSTEQVLASGTPTEPFWLILLTSLFVRELCVRLPRSESVLSRVRTLSSRPAAVQFHRPAG
jgi:hypothetical protein